MREPVKPGLKSRVVCVMSTNPLSLGELERLVAPSGLRTRRARLNLNSSVDVHELTVPNASVYVLDAWSTGVATDAVVSGLLLRRPHARMIVVTGKVSEASFPLLQLGVKGLVTDREAPEALAGAVATVAEGGVWVPRSLLTKFVDRIVRRTLRPRHEPATRRLTFRERQVLKCVMRSLSNKEIASALHISESTVKFHMAQLFRKYGVRRRSDLILQAVQQPGAVM